EKNETIGGLLRFGLPDFKLNKKIIDRRLALMAEEGVEFKTGVHVGKDITGKEIMEQFDAVCLAVGAEQPRDLPIKGRELKGVYFALEFLGQQNRVVAGKTFSDAERISAKGKHVLVIGGGDTGSDCVGTSVRHGAASVTQIEIMPMPPAHHNPATPWPTYPMVLKTSSSHEEGCTRRWNLETKQFIGKDGKLTEVEIEEVEWRQGETGMTIHRTGNKETLKVDLVFLAMGFVHPVHEGLLTELGVELDGRKNVAVNAAQQSSVSKVFAAGDAHLGASLVVRAIASGRKAAEEIDTFLK
ncbi:MAG: glutamate synthase subunit beta, partial [Bacteroidota bacterium]|nr:glutamate synthase subunit beta [Bacteroidota bacterium]